MIPAVYKETMMTHWAIQRADQRWLAKDYGWTDQPEGVLRFRTLQEAEEQGIRLSTSGIACCTVAASETPNTPVTETRGPAH